MKLFLCGQMTNHFKSCQRRVSFQGDVCFFHATADEKLERNTEHILAENNRICKTSSKRRRLPNKGTITWYVLDAILKNSQNGELVSRKKIENHVMKKRKSTNINLFRDRLTKMTRKGQIVQIRMSYRLGSNFPQNLKKN